MPMLTARLGWIIEVVAASTEHHGLPGDSGIGAQGACNDTNPAVAITRTAKSRVVICETGAGRLYYKELGLDSGLPIEIDDPMRIGTGFLVTNEGVQYSLSRAGLVITQGSEVLSYEAMLEYWSQ